jgi:hypothetical protein
VTGATGVSTTGGTPSFGSAGFAAGVSLTRSRSHGAGPSGFDGFSGILLILLYLVRYFASEIAINESA